MVKRPFVNVLGPPKICQVLADLIADRNRKAQKANKHIGQGDASFRDSNSKGQPNLPRKSQPCPSSSSVGFIPRTRMASPRRSARNPSGWEKCAKTTSMDVMISSILEQLETEPKIHLVTININKDFNRKISYNVMTIITSINLLDFIGIYNLFRITLLAKSQQTPRTAAICLLLEQRTVDLGEAWRSRAKP